MNKTARVFIFSSLMILLSVCDGFELQAQTETKKAVEDSIAVSRLERLAVSASDSLMTDSILGLANLKSDSLINGIQQRVREHFVPNHKKALWMALVIPGGGQIYNRKFWKLPIIYGGFLGCTYALLWNQQMYKDYSQAYIDIMDDNPKTASYEKMLPLGYSIAGREEQFKNIFKHKKDFYRRNRDLSIFAFVGVYLLSVIDAYVDAQLSTFDLSKDLSMRIQPTSFSQKSMIGSCTQTLGLQLGFSAK